MTSDRVMIKAIVPRSELSIFFDVEPIFKKRGIVKINTESIREEDVSYKNGRVDLDVGFDIEINIDGDLKQKCSVHSLNWSYGGLFVESILSQDPFDLIDYVWRYKDPFDLIDYVWRYKDSFKEISISADYIKLMKEGVLR